MDLIQNRVGPFALGIDHHMAALGYLEFYKVSDCIRIRALVLPLDCDPRSLLFDQAHQLGRRGPAAAPDGCPRPEARRRQVGALRGA